MKFRFLIILLFASSFLAGAQANIADDTDTISGVKINYPEIVYQKTVVGKIKQLPNLVTSKSNHYKIQIFGKKGSLVAEYEVEVLNKQKKNQDVIVSAALKTMADNVSHSGSNFIDFHFQPAKQNEDAALQLTRLIRYLVDYKYL